MVYKKYLIEGMHCRSCEILITEALEELSDVKEVKANFRKGEIEISSAKPLNEVKVAQIIEKAGYQIGNKKPTWLNSDPSYYYSLSIALVIFVLAYVLATRMGFTGFSFFGSKVTGLSVVFLVGLTAGVSTCMALVGGLILSISAKFAQKHPGASGIQKFRPHLFFNLGRIVTFSVLGGLIGLIGKSFQFSNSIFGILIIAVSVVMLVLGLQLVEIFPGFSKYKLTLPVSVTKIFGLKEKNQQEYSHLNSLILGGLTFFLPCGFTQAMQIYAVSTGNFFSGAAVMGIFALGTTPGLIGIGAITSFVKGALAKKFFVIVGLIIILLAFFNFKNGFKLLGLNNIRFSQGQNDQTGMPSDPNVVTENGVQIVKMTQSQTGYFPNKFTIKKGIPVKWIINSTSPYTCASALVSRPLKIDQFLKAGENDFEFTPEKTGIISFSCSMGMYTGQFVVVD